MGPGEPLVRLLPGPRATVWHYLNAASVLLALMAWTLGAVALVRGRKGRA